MLVELLCRKLENPTADSIVILIGALLCIILPYLIGSAFGGVAAGLWGRKIPTLWLHRFLGAMILWGGVRYLC